MGRRKNDTLSRKTGKRPYRPVCWVSAEGTTERDYFHMQVFKEARASVKFSKDTHPSRRNPRAVLKRLQETMSERHFKDGDEAWLVVDVDDWGSEELKGLLDWVGKHPGCRLAVSNPKFELFLVMHFERAAGCTTPEKVDAALKRHIPRYDKRLSPTQFSIDEVREAVGNARLKRASCPDELPAPGMTDVYKLVESLLGEGVEPRG